jgi:nitrile hydratase subunit beta
MKGGHDLGGQQGMGPINPEPESTEPVFHAEWERRVFGLTLASGMLGKWNIDESRHARERQDPLQYLENSYYENWLEGLETLLVEKGLIDRDELREAKAASTGSEKSLSAPNPEVAQKILASGATSTMPSDGSPLFSDGDRVRVQSSTTKGHTRAPQYARGATGTIVTCVGCHSFPDSNAAGVNEGQYLYTVSFNGSDLFDDSSTNTENLIDLWEPYLEAAN